MFVGGLVRWHNESWKTCYSTLAGNRSTSTYKHDSDDEIKHLQLQIGSKLYPEYPISSHSECFYKLRKSRGAQANNLLALDIKGYAYGNNNFGVGFDTEKMLGLAFIGMNINVSVMTINLKPDDGEHQATIMHIVVVAQQVLEVSDTSITIFA